MRFRPAPLLACALALTALGRPALADPGLNKTEIRVSSEGLDLATQAGADQYLERLARAAAKVCGETRDTSPVVRDAARKFRHCQAMALTETVGRSRSSMVRREFAAKLEAGSLRLAKF